MLFFVIYIEEQKQHKQEETSMRNTAVKLAVATAAIGMATAAGQGETVYA